MKDQYLAESASFDRLCREYEKHGTLYIGFDFDGTVHDFHKTGARHDNVISLLRRLKSIGCKLICWTAYKNIDYINNYLVEHKIPFDSINEGGVDLGYESIKPYFNALLDDRAGLIQVYNELSALVDIIKLKNGHAITN